MATVYSVEQLQRLYTKTISNTDVEERLAFPVRLIDYVWLGPADQTRLKDFRVVDRFGNGWDFRAHMRWDSQGHPKPEVYGSEWKLFVRINQLRVGDRLVFYLHPHPVPDRVVFVLGVKRDITLLGQTFSADVTP